MMDEFKFLLKVKKYNLLFYKFYKTLIIMFILHKSIVNTSLNE